MKKIAKNYIYNVIYQIVVLLAPIATAPYLARTLGAEMLGVSNYVVTVASIFATLGLLGTQNYSVREIAYVRNDKQRLEATFYELYLVRLILCTITTAIYIPYIAIAGYSKLMCIEYMYVVAVFIDPCWFYIGMEDMGKAEIPAPPTIGLIFFFRNRFRNFANRTPPIVSITKANRPIAMIISVSRRTN